MWDWTLADFTIYVEGHYEKIRMEKENLILNTYLGAQWMAQANNGKKVEPFNKILKQMGLDSGQEFVRETVDSEKAMQDFEEINRLRGDLISGKD